MIGESIERFGIGIMIFIGVAEMTEALASGEAEYGEFMYVGMGILVIGLLISLVEYTSPD
jgi:hypothetical protein